MWHSDTADMPVSGPATLEVSLETSLQTELTVSRQFSNYIVGIYAREKKNIFSHENLHENLLSFIPNGKKQNGSSSDTFQKIKNKTNQTITEQPRRKSYS